MKTRAVLAALCSLAICACDQAQQESTKTFDTQKQAIDKAHTVEPILQKEAQERDKMIEGYSK